MRLRSIRRPFPLLLGAFALAASLLAGAAQADRHETLRGEADALGAANAQLGEREHRALLELYALETSLARAERRSDGLRARLDRVRRDEADARRRLAAARQAEAVAQAQLEERLRALYVEGEPDPLEVILGAATLDDAISAIDSLARLAEEDRRIADQAGQARASLRRAIERLNGRAAELEALVREADAASAALVAARDEKAGYVEELRSVQALNQAEIERLETEAAEASERTQALGPERTTESAPAPAPAAPQQAAEPAPPPAGGSRTLTVDAVAYSLPGLTASGLPVGPGVVAVDPTVIPLGTRLYVPGYGRAIAADTGSAIKGLIIDLWFPTYEQAVAWGRKTVTITIYD